MKADPVSYSFRYRFSLVMLGLDSCWVVIALPSLMATVSVVSIASKKATYLPLLVLKEVFLLFLSSSFMTSAMEEMRDCSFGSLTFGSAGVGFEYL